jgi:hypothetical protein
LDSKEERPWKQRMSQKPSPTVIVLQLFILLSWSASAQSSGGQGSEGSANELIRHVVANGLKAEQQDTPLEFTKTLSSF